MLSHEAGRPRTTLNHLPTEIKAFIAQLCSEQDRRYKEWSTAYDKLHGRVAIEAKRLQDGVHGRSVATLFVLSKEWSDFAAPYRFEVISADRAQKPLFRFSIATKYSQHFVHARIDSRETAINLNLMSLLPSFPRLHTVTLGALAQVTLFPHPSKNSVERAPCDSEVYWMAKALAKMGGRIQKLHLVGLGRVAIVLLDFFPNLRHLHLADSHTHDRQLFLKFVKALNNRSIEGLHFECPNHITFETSRFPLDLVWPPVRTLTIEAKTCDSLAFLGSFSETLCHLTIVSEAYTEEEAEELRGGEREPDNPYPFLDQSFILPRLSQLTIKGSHRQVEPILLSITHTSFPSLTDLTIGVQELDLSEQILEDVEHLANLSTLRAYDPDIVESLDTRGTVRERMESRPQHYSRTTCQFRSPIEFPQVEHFDASVNHRRLYLREDLHQSALRLDVEKTVQFLNETLQHARRADDSGAYANLARVLLAVELERRAQRD